MAGFAGLAGLRARGRAIGQVLRVGDVLMSFGGMDEAAGASTSS